MAGYTVVAESSSTRKRVRKLDDFLNDLAEELAPSPEFIRNANRVMHLIFLKLQEKSKFKVDRLEPAGGKEKKTSVSYSIDYDLVAFVNNERPPFKKVLDDFEDIILGNFDPEEGDMTKTRRSLCFTLDGIDFDLLPATSMAKSQDPDETWRKQRWALLAEIRKEFNPIEAASLHSAGLTETAVEFVKQQSTFVHKVARLAKCWNSTIICTEPLFGRSYTFELLGIQAGRDEENREERRKEENSILRAFRFFLKRVVNIGQQRIIFSYSDDFYSRSDMLGEILEQTPLILDPSNPYNNVVASFCGRDSVHQLFSSCAKETSNRLERVGEEIKRAVEFPHLKEIFLPQPRPPFEGPVRMPQNWLLGVESGAGRLQPKVVVRNALLNKEKRSEISAYQKAFSAFLFISDIEANYKISDDRKMSARQSIEKSIDHLLGRSTESGLTKWMPSHNTHGDYDVTFEIPIGLGGGDALIVSSNWA